MHPLSKSTTEPIPATVDPAAATQAALDWARRFYRLKDFEILAMEFERQPTRFWRVTFLVSDHRQTVRLYAVMLPVEPTVRDER